MTTTERLAGAERLVVRLALYGLFLVGLVGLALSLGAAFGAWTGWLAVVVASALPGGAILRRDLDDRSIARDRADQAPERWTATEG